MDRLYLEESISNAVISAYDLAHIKVRKSNNYLYVGYILDDSNTNLKVGDNIVSIDGVKVNSNEECLPHIVNFSVIGIKPETLLHALCEDEIYISTKTACSSDDYSESVLEITKDMDAAKSSLRVSISHLTKESELDFFITKLQEKIKNLKSISN